MLAAQFLSMERALETAMRSLSERAELCRHMFAKLPDSVGRAEEREQWAAARRQALDLTEPLRTLLTLPWIHPASGQNVERGDK